MKLSFKLKESTHNTVSTITKYLCYIGYVAVMISLSYKAVSSYLEASEILSDFQTVEANLTFTGVTEERKKRHTVSTYHFAYAFTVDGKEYTKAFTTSEDNSDKFMGKESVMVAYSTTNPAKHGRLSRLENNNSIAGKIKSVVLASVVMAVVIWIVYLYITASLFVVKKNEEVAETQAA